MVSKADLKRYVLIGLCVCSLILVFLPLFEVDVLFADYSISTWNIIRQAAGEDADLEGADWMAVICAVLLIVIPLVHLLKLCGVFGKPAKSSRFASILLSVGQFLAILGFAYFLVFYENDFEEFELNLLTSLLTPWFYIWLVLIVVMMVFSFMLDSYDAGKCDVNPAPVQTALFCSACGRRLTSSDAFCPGCGTPRR